MFAIDWLPGQDNVSEKVFRFLDAWSAIVGGGSHSIYWVYEKSVTQGGKGVGNARKLMDVIFECFHEVTSYPMADGRFAPLPFYESVFKIAENRWKCNSFVNIFDEVSSKYCLVAVTTLEA